MATTPTNKPIPSEDPRDLKFNAGKIDEEVNGSADYYTDRFSVQRLTNTGRNNQFQDAQLDKENRFQQFLLNSGYEFLGDYENGPYTIEARNQIIRYQNEFWRLNAATTPPYTTTGTNSTSWVTDVTHFVYVGDAYLRQELASTLDYLGGSMVGTPYNLNVTQMLDLGRVVYPEMYHGGLENPTDDQLWDNMFAALTALPDTALSNDLPYVIDMRGKVYNILETHQVDINLGIINGFVHFNGGRFILGDYSSTGKTRRYHIDFRWDYIGTSYFPYALVEIVRAYNTHIRDVTCWGGVSTSVETSGDYIGKPKRARYALWLGSRRAWGCSIISGDIYGGEIPLRVGYTNDHTGIFIGAGLTIHHGWAGNILGCNLTGSTILGCNIEHSENGAWSIALTSGTNGVNNPLSGVLISGVYCYNNGNGTSGTDYAPAAILVGYDVPGTIGFDASGSLITSDGQAQHVTIQNCKLVSPKQLRAVKMKGLAGLKCINNVYTMATGESYAFTFEGTAARSDCTDNRNQSSGVFDEVEYTSSSRPRIGNRAGTFLPQLVGATTAGSLTYGTRNASYVINDGYCTLTLFFAVTAISTQPSGAISIQLPVAIQSGFRAPGTVRAQALSGTVTIDGVVYNKSVLGVSANLISGTALQLFFAGGVMDGSLISSTTAMEISIVYPVAAATYTGA